MSLAEKVKKDYLSGMKNKEIMDKYGFTSPQQIYNKLGNIRLRCPDGRGTKKDSYKTDKKRYKNIIHDLTTMPIEEVKKRYSIKGETLQKILKENPDIVLKEKWGVIKDYRDKKAMQSGDGYVNDYLEETTVTVRPKYHTPINQTNKIWG